MLCRRERERIGVAAGLVVVAALAAAEIRATEDPATIGQVKTLSGEARLFRDDRVRDLAVGESLREGDTLETGPSGTMGITFADGTTFAVGPETRISVDEFRFDSGGLQGNLLADIQRGTLSVVSGEMTKVSPDALKIRTPRAILGVRGTEFLVRVDPPAPPRPRGNTP